MRDKKIVILFSGGTDSTLTSALMAEKFKRIYLITYSRFGLFAINNSKTNVEKLRDKFKNIYFSHHIIKVNKLFNYVSYEHYFHHLIKHRFFLLSTCGLCKLAMHIRTVIFCLKNDVVEVCDGANKNMRLFPDQMASVMQETRKMYAHFGINYTSPVFEFGQPDVNGFNDRLRQERISPLIEKKGAFDKTKKNTTRYKLFEFDLMPSENVKGSKIDQKMQPRCFQFILFRIFAQWYYLPNHTYNEYEQASLQFFKEKIDFFTALIDDFIKKNNKSKLFRMIED